MIRKLLKFCYNKTINYVKKRVHNETRTSWNIDSLNAALTSDSARAKLSQEVLQTLSLRMQDIIAIQETKLSAKGPTKNTRNP